MPTRPSRTSGSSRSGVDTGAHARRDRRTRSGYGYSEQIAVPTTQTQTVRQYQQQPITKRHLQQPSPPDDGTREPRLAGPPVVTQYLNEPWDYSPQ